MWYRRLDMNGKILEETQPGLNPEGYVSIPFLFQGQYYDHETGLTYNRFRYYDPELGRYISEDPIGFLGGTLNVYGYVENTMLLIDPLALSGRGGTIHRRIQDELSKDLGKAKRYVDTEGQIKLSNNTSRFGDVVVRDDTGIKIVEVHQIGDMRSRGGFHPSSRERGAIMDIREALGDDVRIIFHDKKQRVTLIDPDKGENWKIPSAKHRKLSYRKE